MYYVENFKCSSVINDYATYLLDKTVNNTHPTGLSTSSKLFADIKHHTSHYLSFAHFIVYPTEWVYQNIDTRPKEINDLTR